MTPPIDSTRARTTDMPTPRPEIALTHSAVLTPSTNERGDEIVVRGGRQPQTFGFRPNRIKRNAPAVVTDGDHEVGAFPRCGQANLSLSLAERLAFVGHLESVIDRIAHDVDEV